MTEQGAAGDEQRVDGEDQDALLSRLRLIEDQPLGDRASSYVQLHEELQASLEGGDAPRRDA